MKHTALALGLCLFAQATLAQTIDVADLEGDQYYGLYLMGNKSGWAFSGITVQDDGSVEVEEDAQIRVVMGGLKQEMRVYAKRVYESTGELRSIVSRVDDPSGQPSTYTCTVEEGELLFKSAVGGAVREERLPLPEDSLDDFLKQRRLVGPDAKVGDVLEFSFFEPMHKRSIGGVSRVAAIEDRVLDGTPTRVFVIKTRLDLMNLDTVSYMTEDGTLLEDVTAGFITMRLEPKEMAQDVSYSNDVIVSNAAMVDEPIHDARTRDTLKLRLNGPLTDEHIFNDERQSLARDGDVFSFEGRMVALDGFERATLPVTAEDVAPWIAPSMYIQSDDARLITQAKAIANGETDAYAVSTALCNWVYANVRKRFSARLTNSLEVLEGREGDCTEHSVLFVGLARAAGLPAREVAGLVYVSEPEPGFFFHQWAKVWVGKWIDVDPTFDQPLVDVTHIKLAEGDLLSQAKIIPIIGRIEVDVLDGASAKE
jgi:hypothetical protein